MDDGQHLRRQVERILDEDASQTPQVIVRVEAPEEYETDVVRTVMDGIRRRAFCCNPRDLLPPDASTLSAAAAKPTAGQLRELKSAPGSVAARVLAKAIINSIAVAALKEVGLGALTPLLQSDAVTEGLNKVVDRWSKTKSPKSIQDISTPLWAANSAILTMPRNDLRRLIDEPSIRDIYPNVPLSVPPMVAASDMPSAVKDNEGFAWGMERTGAMAAWGGYGARGEGTLVGLLDTGIDPNHPDLKGKITAWAEFDSLGNTVAEAYTQDQIEAIAYDSVGHGTMCAGVICGGNSSGRYIGMAPDAKLAVGLVMKDGTARLGQVLYGLQWAIEQGVDVINLSLGASAFEKLPRSPYENILYSAMLAGIPVVTAIGNSGAQTSEMPGDDYFTLSVGATDYRDRTAGFSGGRAHRVLQSKVLPAHTLPIEYSKPELSAPGVAIYSSAPTRNGKPQWQTTNGTSMAAPHVTGAIAQLLSATGIKRKIAPSALRSLLLQDLILGAVEELGEVGLDHRYGFGRLDVLRAIGAAHSRGYGK